MPTRTAKNKLGKTRKTARKDVSSMKNALQTASESLSKGAKGFIAWLEKGMPAVRAGLGTFGKYAKDSATAIDKELQGGWASIKKRLMARKEPAPARKPAAKKTGRKPAAARKATTRKKAAVRRKVEVKKAPARRAAARKKAAPRRKAAGARK
jgi:hypothetical protein